MNNEPSETDFRFISLQSADDVRNPTTKRMVRSHVGKLSHQKRKAKMIQNFSQFKVYTQDTMAAAAAAAPATQQRPPDPQAGIHVHRLDPFDTLAVDALKLQELLNHPRAQQAVEPVFSISDPFSFHNVRDAYQTGFSDPAFVNALFCAITFATRGDKLVPEVLQYQGRAIQHIQSQLGGRVSLDCTVGAILLLVGIEWRLGSGDIARIHLGGINQLVQISAANPVQLSPSTRRGIFWQDLSTAIVTNSDRTFTRDTFPEFQWGTAFMFPWAQLPIGFESMRSYLGPSLAKMLQDVHVLQRITEDVGTDPNDIAAIHDIDNHQACIEARLQENICSLTEVDSLLVSLLVAAYLFSYSLFTSVWNGNAIPDVLSERLLGCLQKLFSDSLWRQWEQAIFWCIMVGGSLSPSSATREQYIILLRNNYKGWSGTFLDSWPTIEPFLENFIWSKQRFSDRGKSFWEASLQPAPSCTIESVDAPSPKFG